MPRSLVHVLQIQRFRMRYPRSLEWVLNDLNLEIKRGESIALVGPSGCGKSSVARSLLQLLPEGSLCEGKLLLNGKDLTKLGKYSLRKMRGEQIGMVFQDPMTRLNPLMTIGNHLLDTLIAHWPQEIHLRRVSYAKELLDKVGINQSYFNSFPHELSGGMRQRVAIALAIALKPPLLIADEPTTSLDSAVADVIMRELNSLCKEIDSSLLLISHDLAMAGRWCDRIAFVDQGKIVEEGPIGNILSGPKSSIAKRLVSAIRTRESGIESKSSLETIVLKVDRLRCWLPCGGLPWDVKWIKAVDEVSFYINAGECLGLVGPSGCGKSTLCRALMGLIAIKGGEVNLKGKNILALKGETLKKVRRSLQMVFQDPLACLNPKMMIGECIYDPLILHNILTRSEAREKSRELLKLVGLDPPEEYQARYPCELSGGQLQRVAIARALALRPEVLICDESLSMLDAEIQSEILILLRSLQKNLGLSILFITHDLALASGFCHRIMVLHKGNIVETGYSKDILNAPKTEVTKRLIEASNKLY